MNRLFSTFKIHKCKRSQQKTSSQDKATMGDPDQNFIGDKGDNNSGTLLKLHDIDLTIIPRKGQEVINSDPIYDSTNPGGWGTRHTLALMGFLGFAASFAMRVNLSIAIVAMVITNPTVAGMTQAVRNESEKTCPDLFAGETLSRNLSNLTSNQMPPGEFNWSSEDQGTILGSFYWGYVMLQIPGGILAKKIGGKWLFGFGMLISSIFTLLTPLAAWQGMGFLVACRILQGLGEGVSIPAMHALLARWMPPLERSRLGTYIYAGQQFGTILGLPLCGYLISDKSLGGWPSVFYTMGTMGVIWFIFWAILVFDKPQDHPRISPQELLYIQSTIGLQISTRKVPTPWKKMLTSMPVIAILVAHIGHDWGTHTLLTELPTYLGTVLHFDIKSNGWISALPYLMMFIVSLVCCWLADFLLERNIATTTTVRKLLNTIGHLLPAFALIGVAYSGCDRILTVALLTAAVGLSGACYASFNVNHIDIAANHAAVMMGITSGFANLMGILAPYVAGVIIGNVGSLSQWRLIFLIAGGIYIFDNTFYLIFASGKEQIWNRNKCEQEKLKSNSN